MPLSAREAAIRIREHVAVGFHGHTPARGEVVREDLTHTNSALRFEILFRLLNLVAKETGSSVITTYSQACTMFVQEIEAQLPKTRSATLIVFHDGSSLSLKENDKYTYYQPKENFELSMAAHFFPDDSIVIFPAL